MPGRSRRAVGGALPTARVATDATNAADVPAVSAIATATTIATAIGTATATATDTTTSAAT